MSAPPSTPFRSAGSGAALLGAVLVGGALGTGLRMAGDLLLPHGDTDFPLSTLLINIVGSFVLGLLVAAWWGKAAAWVKAGLGTGLIGSFTTYSAVMVSLVAQAANGLWLPSIGYLLASLVLGLGAALLGLRLGSRRAAPPPPIDWVEE